jgi:hypothetical protein
MKIKFEFRNKELWLESDSREFIIHEGFYVDPKTGTEHRTNSAYVYQFKQAIIYLLNKGIKFSDAETLKELMRDYSELKKIIRDGLDFGSEVEE